MKPLGGTKGIWAVVLALGIGVAGDAGGSPGQTNKAVDDRPIVNTTSGRVKGFNQDGLSIFLGIPYAAPPVGDRRWQPPQPVEPWTGVRKARRFGAPCPQFDFFGNLRGKEDCLFLNVWTPGSSLAEGLPVMVWIHGGGYITGSGDGGLSFIDRNPIYDGQYLARNENLVVVSFNYRLGPLGFLAHPDLTNEDPGRPSSGNYGQEDQAAALEWVRNNIAAFGGDPNNITLFGESAGGISVTLHLVSPQSMGLFHHAIIQSGAASTILTSEQAEAQGLALAAALLCSGEPAEVLGCLRSQTVDEILNALPLPAGLFLGEGAFWFPVVDGFVIPEQPLDAFVAGNFSQVPLIIGNTAHEGTLFLALVGAGLTPDDYNDFLVRFFGTQAANVLAEYPCSQSDCSAFDPPRFLLTPADNAIAEVVTNGLFICSSRRVARAISHTAAPIYSYIFTHEIDPPFWSFAVGATHAAELSFVFGTAVLSRLTEEEMPLSQAIMSYWADFARNGNPNHEGVPEWPAYSFAPDSNNGEDEALLELDLQINVASGFGANNCDFFDELFLGQ